MSNCVVVTGGAGFIGSHIVDKLIAAGNEVIVIDDLSTGKKENLNPDAIFYEIDISDYAALAPVFQKHSPDYVIHEAAKINLNVKLEDPTKDVHSSVLGTVNLLKHSVANKVRKFIYASSVAVYGSPEKLPASETDELRPIYSYGIVKKCAEDYCRYFFETYGLKYAVLRYGNVYGPRQPIFGEVGVIAIYTDRVIKGDPLVIFGDGEHLRDYIFVDDAVDATLKVIDTGENEVFNVGRGAGVSVNTVFEQFNACYDNKLEVHHKPERVGELGNFYTDSGRIEAVLGWKSATGIMEGIGKTIDYYRKSDNT